METGRVIGHTRRPKRIDEIAVTDDVRSAPFSTTSGPVIVILYSCATALPRLDSDVAQLHSISEAVRRDQIVTHFQPITSARRGMVIGLEALARREGLAGQTEPTADGLFRDAAKEAITDTLERHCCKSAIQNFAKLRLSARDVALFLNLGSWLTVDPEQGLADLRRFVCDAGLPPQRIAIEILEARIEDTILLRYLVQKLRSAGFLLVLDDVGKGYSNLDRVALIKPDVLKIDRALISGINRDFHRQETLKSLVGLSRRIGAATVAEGIETEDEAIVSLELGVDMLQGYFLDRPRPGASVDQSIAGASRAMAVVAHRLKDCMIKKIHRHKVQQRLLTTVVKAVTENLATLTQEDFDSSLENAIEVHPELECLYVLDRTGAQITHVVSNASMARQKHSMLRQSSAKDADHSLQEYFYALVDLDLKRFITDPQIAFASGNVSRTMSAQFRHRDSNDLYVLCIEVAAPAASYRLR